MSSVRLVPLTMEHLPLVMTWVNDREVMQYFAMHQKTITEDDERRYLAKLLSSSTDRAFSMFDADSKIDDATSYVGQCSVNQIYWPAKNGRVFLVVRKEKQGAGLGRAAITSLIEKAFGDLNLHKLWLIVRRDNRRSQAMYVRAGFEFEGVLRDEYCVADQYFDMVRMGIVNPNLNPNPSPDQPVP